MRGSAGKSHGGSLIQQYEDAGFQFGSPRLKSSQADEVLGGSHLTNICVCVKSENNPFLVHDTKNGFLL